jgi:sulfite reductase (NADPH) hemoprotein beta-component/sulfite reductase (ferredoxin)
MAELNEVEGIKAASKGLRGTLLDGLFSEEPGFSSGDAQLIKFHGIYQQRDRDQPKEQSPTSFMLRARMPGGRLSASQWLAWDALADEMGGGSLRLTTRQSLQLHGVVKKDLKATVQRIHAMSLSTLGACGDVVRNVTEAANPWGRSDLAQLDGLAESLSEHFKWRSRAYAELWLDEAKQELKDDKEPLYGEAYLPRKFKMAVTLAGHNDIDIYSNDLAFVATLGPDGAVDGAFVLAGGGMGMTHGMASTFPRAADLLGWAPAASLLKVAEACVAVHRDFGDRSNRKHARLKYVLAEKGVAWFRGQVEASAGIHLEQRPLPAWKTPSLLGWHARADGTLALGVHLLSGRLRDAPGRAPKAAVAEVVRRFSPTLQLTADQDLVLMGLAPQDKAEVESILIRHGFTDYLSPSPIYDRALACPALPTCGLALTEAERVVDGLLCSVDSVLQGLGLQQRAPVLRLTGCPNGCARPFNAEIGVVGQMKGKYALFIGGHPEGLRVGRLWKQKVDLDKVAETLRPLLALWKEQSKPEESLGDWVQRVGFESLAQL